MFEILWVVWFERVGERREKKWRTGKRWNEEGNESEKKIFKQKKGWVTFFSRPLSWTIVDGLQPSTREERKGFSMFLPLNERRMDVDTLGNHSNRKEKRWSCLSRVGVCCGVGLRMYGVSVVVGLVINTGVVEADWDHHPSANGR